jgi:hypothetical protein
MKTYLIAYIKDKQIKTKTVKAKNLKEARKKAEGTILGITINPL